MGLVLRRSAWLLPAALVLLLYARTVGYGFAWDDFNYLYHEAGLRDWSFLWRALTRPFLDSYNYFRPLVLISYALEQRAGGSAALSHATNVIIAAANALLVGALARRSAAQLAPGIDAARAGVFAGLVYAAHPALVEATAWISGRFDLAFTFFGLLLLWCDRAIARTAPRVAACALLFLLAALCKEAALGLALVLPLWQWMHAPADAGAAQRRGDLFALLGAAAGGLIYLVLRHGALGYLHMDVTTAPYADNVGHAAMVFMALAGYAGLVLLPFGSVGPQHELPPQGIEGFGAQALMGLLVLLLLLALAWRALRGSRRQLLPLCAALALVPALNIVPIEIKQNYMHDRFLQFPLALLSVWLSLSLGSLPARVRGWAGGLALAWTAACALASASTIGHWQDDLSLWKWAYDRTPRSQTVIDNLQSSLFDAGDYENCRRFSEFIEQQEHGLTPLRRVRYALSLAQVDQGDAAVAQADQALGSPELERTLPSQRASMDAETGWIYLYEGYPEKARERLTEALQLNPSAGEASYYMAATLMVLGDEAGAEPYRERALGLLHPSQQARRAAQLAGFVETSRQRAAGRA
ncbi:MAG TPA: hypothetical protein VHE37_13910, partial [Nevskiaceae bacterium]|nr:hypothetical protein [Nevskiaceae bacterium]